MSLPSNENKGKWTHTTKSTPCPICEKSGWCSVSADGKIAACRHTEAGAWRTKTDKAGVPIYLHRLAGENVRPPIELPAKGAKIDAADADTLHAVYDALVGELALSRSHRDNLHKRGLSDEQIESRLYRTLSVQGRAAKARDLAERFGTETVLSVPGFFTKHKEGRKYLTIAGSAGLVIPCRSVDGKIVALKVRRDIDGPNKYIYLSSAKYGGPGPGAPCHVPLGIGGGPVETVRIAEGELKSDIAYSLSGIPTISFPGVGSWGACLPVLKQLQTKTVCVAFDADGSDNPNVARPLSQCYEALIAEGFTVDVEKWHADHKGIDDALAAGQTPEVMEGDAARDFVAEMLLAATAGEPAPPPNPLDRLGDVLSEGAEALFRDKELMQALARLAVSDKAEYACRRARIQASGVSLREVDKAVNPLCQKFRAEKPPRSSAKMYRVSGGETVRTVEIKDEGTVDIPLANFSAAIVGQVVVDDGAEKLLRLEIEGILSDGTPLPKCEVAADKFSWMDWPLPAWGTHAVVYAGASTKDHMRCAIQLLSGDPKTRTVYAHLGWRNVGERWVYLHAGGAIGADGPAAAVEVAAPAALERYVLPTPPHGDDLRRAVGASLGLLDLGPARLMFPLLAGVYRAVLGPCDFSLHLMGDTGLFKSEVAALVQQHFGPAMDRANLPAAWASTANSLGELAFGAKDSVLVVDDFAPSGSSNAVAKLHSEAERLLRGQGNSAGRGRMRRDGTLAPSKSPRGLILSTGEDVPRGQSLRARLLILEAGKGDFGPKAPAPNPKLTAAQADAAAGLYAASLSGFVRWIAPRYEMVRDGLPAERAKLRDAASADGQHARTPNLVADLVLGLRYFFDFAVEAGALDKSERDDLARRGWSALLKAASTQQEHQSAADPVEAFLRLLSAAVASGRAHVASMVGNNPDAAGAWGWRQETYRNVPEWIPQGRRIGWIDGDNLYLEPDAAYASVQGMAGEQGEGLTVSPRTLWTRMRERHLLVGWEKPRFTVRRLIAGKQHAVLFLHTDALVPQESVHCAQSVHSGEKQGENDAVSMHTSPPMHTPEVCIGPEVCIETNEKPAGNEGNEHFAHNAHSHEQGSDLQKKKFPQAGTNT